VACQVAKLVASQVAKLEIPSILKRPRKESFMKNLNRIALMVGGVVALAGLTSSSARAEGQKSGEDKKAAFESRKAERLSHMDQRIQKMQEHRSCVAAAADGDAMKKCHESMKEFMEEKRQEWKSKRQGH
jgi:hypothetical protein